MVFVVLMGREDILLILLVQKVLVARMDLIPVFADQMVLDFHKAFEVLMELVAHMYRKVSARQDIHLLLEVPMVLVNQGI